MTICKLQTRDLESLLAERTRASCLLGGLSVRSCVAALPARAGTMWSEEIECLEGITCRLARMRLDRSVLIEVDDGQRLPLVVRLKGDVQLGARARTRGWTHRPNRGLLRAAHPEESVFIKGGQELELVKFWIPPQVFAELAQASFDVPSHRLLAAVSSNDGHVIADARLPPQVRLAISQMKRPFDNPRARLMYVHAKAFEVALLLLDTIWSSAAEDAPPRRVRAAERARIERAHRMALNDPANIPTVAELARQVQLSETTLRAGFRALYGQSIYAYMRVRRLELAHEILSLGKSNVEEAARAVGYSCSGRFASAFRSHFGVRPVDVRAHHKESAATASLPLRAI